MARAIKVITTIVVIVAVCALAVPVYGATPELLVYPIGTINDMDNSTLPTGWTTGESSSGNIYVNTNGKGGTYVAEKSLNLIAGRTYRITTRIHVSGTLGSGKYMAVIVGLVDKRKGTEVDIRILNETTKVVSYQIERTVFVMPEINGELILSVIAYTDSANNIQIFPIYESAIYDVSSDIAVQKRIEEANSRAIENDNKNASRAIENDNKNASRQAENDNRNASRIADSINPTDRVYESQGDGGLGKKKEELESAQNALPTMDMNEFQSVMDSANVGLVEYQKAFAFVSRIFEDVTTKTNMKVILIFVLVLGLGLFVLGRKLS